MLFSIRHFEHHIGETALNQGLKLFQKGAVELQYNRHLPEWRFAGKNFELVLHKKGDKLLSYHCSCQKTSLCQHLAASLFLLQKENFGGFESAKKSITRPAGKTLLEQLSPIQALAYLQNQGVDKAIRKELDAALTHDGEPLLFANALLLLDRLLALKQLPEKLNQAKIQALTHRLNSFLDPHPRHNVLAGQSFYLYLAALCQLQKLLQWRFGGNETELRDIRLRCELQLDARFSKGLNQSQREAWLKALLLSLSNNLVARSGAYSFLLPRYLCFCRSHSSLQELRTLVEKRKTSPPKLLPLNPIAIARQQIYLKEHQLKRMPATSDNTSIEESLAHIDLLFCCGKTNKAFKLAQQALTAHRTDAYPRVSAFADAVLQKAQQYKRHDVEQHFLEHRLLSTPFVNASELLRWLALLPKEKKEAHVDALLLKLKQPAYYSFQKLSSVLKLLKRPDALIQEIKQHGQAFYLLHEAALEKLPHVDARLLDLYCRQLTQQLNSTGLYSHQISLFETALEFINRLKEDERLALLQKVAALSGSESQLSKHIYSTCKLVPN